MGNLKVWKDSHSTLRNPQSNTWSVECGVLSIRHKFGARMKVPLETFPDTLTVALTAIIPISPENIHAYAYELKQIFTT